MKIIDIIKDDSIIICPNNIKDKIVKSISNLDKIYSYKIYSESEFKNALFLNYDYKTILYLSKKLNKNYHIVKEYLQAISYVDLKSYNSKKLNNLVLLKKDLIENNLVKENKNIKNLIENKNIYVYGFDVIDKELLKALSYIKKYEIINEDSFSNTKPIVYKFNTLEEEVEATCYEISKLLEQNIDINKIKIANANSDYNFTLQRYLKMYNIPFNKMDPSSLYSYRCVKQFYDYCLNTNSLKQGLDFFLTNYKEEVVIYKKLLNISNDFVLFDFGDIKDIFKEILKETTIKEINKNAIEFIDLDNQIFDKDEYVFVLSINQSIYPKTYKDDEFLSDNEKIELNLDTSEEKNIASKIKFEKLLSKSNNLFLSYKEKTSFANFNKSFVLEELKLKQEEYKKDFLISYSKQADKLKLAKIYDQIYKDTNELEVSVLSNNYELDYKTYKHKFKKFSGSKIISYLKQTNKSLSYSSINNYFECGFKYYLNNILNLGEDKEIRSAKIGSVYHKILELSNLKDFDFEKTFEEQVLKENDVVTKFYLYKFKDALKDIIKLNKENLKDSLLTKQKNEQRVEVFLKDPTNIKFKGFVDKILYTTKDNKTYVAIIDYKTGETEINLNKVKYGLSLQVPIYLYLLKNSNIFDDVVFCGFYIQKLLPPTVEFKDGYENTIKSHIQLQGYSNSSKAILSVFDPHFSNSSLIKSMKENKDGSFNKYAKVLSNEEMDELSNLVKEKIEEAFKEICNCNFEISPKILEGKNQSCKYCEFKDCCYKLHDDNVYLDSTEETEEEMVGEF